MSDKQTYKTEAFVLHTMDYGESDRIVRFYTDRYGKLSGIAKGARRSKRRFANALEPFSRSTMMFRRGRGDLAFIESCEVIEYYPGIRGSLERMLAAFYFLELVEQFTPEGKKNTELFGHLRSFLGMMDMGMDSDGIVRFFELRMLKIMGYDPFLENCQSCKRPLENAGVFKFSFRDGGIRCEACASSMTDALMSPGTLKTLLLGKNGSPEALARIAFTDKAARESSSALTRFIKYLLGKELKSFNILNEIRTLSR